MAKSQTIYVAQGLKKLLKGLKNRIEIRWI